MRLNKKLIGILSLLTLALWSFSQERVLGTWKMYLPFRSSSGVYDGGDKIITACTKGIFTYDKATGEIQTYDKSKGLSDVDINQVNYDPATKFVVVAYTNSNIDLIQNLTDVYNITDIKDASANGAITINSISFFNGNAYLSTNLGITVINLSRKEIEATYVIGSSGQNIKVFATTVDSNYIYAATQEGVKYASYNTPNLQDFNAWTLFTSTQGIPAKSAGYIASYNHKIYASITGGASQDTIFQYDGNIWSPVFYTSPAHITSLAPSNGNLYFSVWDTIYLSWQGKIDAAGNVTIAQSPQHVRPYNWFENNGISWQSDAFNGLYKIANGNVENIVPNGPFSSSVFHLDASGGELCVASGSVDDSWNNGFNQDGGFIYDINSDKWNIYNVYTNNALNGWFDMMCVANSPTTGKTYFGSFWSGVVQIDNATKTVTTFDKDNTNGILQGAVGDVFRTRISAMTTDANGNVWVSDGGSTRPLVLIPADGSAWKSFTIPAFNVLMRKMMVDQNNQVWAPLRPNGILVWSYGNDINDPNGYVSKILDGNPGTGGLPSSDAYALAEDKDGNVWVGTTAGIAVFYCPGSVLTSSGCDASQIKVSRDGYIGYLFGTENVRAIAVDAANRKWVGTTNGVWLVSSDGKTQLLNFNTDNSPLPANQITDIAINDATGEVFIGTVGGLVSYQGDAVGECADCKEALVYPNPVRHDYTGPIAIKGLTDNAYVKITDATGTLAFQGRANGTQMIWDGNGYKGERAKSGVYFVFSSTDLGKEKKVAKILLMN